MEHPRFARNMMWQRRHETCRRMQDVSGRLEFRQRRLAPLWRTQPGWNTNQWNLNRPWINVTSGPVPYNRYENKRYARKPKDPDDIPYRPRAAGNQKNEVVYGEVDADPPQQKGGGYGQPDAEPKNDAVPMNKPDKKQANQPPATPQNSTDVPNPGPDEMKPLPKE
jgi:hypothetical protein